MFYISALTQKIHTSATCSVTRRNHARNLETSTPGAVLVVMGYRGCKRCGAEGELAAARLSDIPGLYAVTVTNGSGSKTLELAGTQASVWEWATEAGRVGGLGEGRWSPVAIAPAGQARPAFEAL